MAFLPVNITIDFRAGDRGLYRLLGIVDLMAPNLQLLKTPNGTPMAIAATQGDGYPRRWSIQAVLEAAPGDMPGFDATEKRIAGTGVTSNLLNVTGADNVSALEVFTSGVVSDLKASAAGIQNYILWVVGGVILLLILILLVRK